MIVHRRGGSLRAHPVANARVGGTFPSAFIGGLVLFPFTCHLDIVEAKVEAARAAHARHAADGLTELPVPRVEHRFKGRESLGIPIHAQSHLRRQVAVSPYFAEICFTDRNGFNFAMIKPTSDFVQSEEGGWQSDRTHGASTGPTGSSSRAS